MQGPVILDASAIVMGNIKSKSVQINNGAVIEGMCSQCYAGCCGISGNASCNLQLPKNLNISCNSSYQIHVATACHITNNTHF